MIGFKACIFSLIYRIIEMCGNYTNYETSEHLDFARWSAPDLLYYGHSSYYTWFRTGPRCADHCPYSIQTAKSSNKNKLKIPSVKITKDSTTNPGSNQEDSLQKTRRFYLIMVRINYGRCTHGQHHHFAVLPQLQIDSLF